MYGSTSKRQMHLHIIVAGFGPGHVPEKRAFLLHNMTQLLKTSSIDIRLTIFCYNDKVPVLVDRVLCDLAPKRLRISIVYATGLIIGQFMYQYCNPNQQFMQPDDYVLLLMDDVTLEVDYQLDTAIELIKTAKLDILSPAMTVHSKCNAHTSYWKQRVTKPNVNTLRKMHQLEYYCYLLPYAGYRKYFKLLTPQSKWLWGIDLILAEEGLAVGIWDNSTFTHHFQNDGYTVNAKADPRAEMSALERSRKRKYAWHKTVLGISEYPILERRNVAICLLTTTLSEAHKHILSYITSKMPDIQVMAILDTPQFDTIDTETVPGATLYSIPDAICRAAGFTGFNPVIAKKPSAWDKVFYIFGQRCKPADFTWILEDDVFIPSLETLQHLIGTYSQGQYDVVSQENVCNQTGDTSYWWWSKLTPPQNMPPLWYKSMVAAVGMSAKTIELVINYVKQQGEGLFVEYIMHTLAMHNKLTVKVAPELSTILYRHSWTRRDFKQRPLNLFHPCKDSTRLLKYGKWS